MVHVADGLWFSAAPEKNISGTRNPEIQDRFIAVNGSGRNAETSASGTCSFVVADWRLVADPFCGAPTRPGSSYCARHRPICIAPRGTAEGRLRAAALFEDAKTAPEPPLELAHLRETALPESLPDDPRDFRALLDHPPPDPAIGDTE